jgi:D-sedoheptulose 7-phosphate isomerase
MNIFETRFNELYELLPNFRETSSRSIEAVAHEIIKTFKNGNKLLICGNGGSAADSQHFAAEFVNKFSNKVSRNPLPALALTTDTSVLTAISNDSEFIHIFSRQIEAHGRQGDLLVVFTTSGNSKNCINAVNSAKLLGIKTVSFTRANAEISEISDLTVQVPSKNTQHIQECHIFAYHVICEIVEQSIYGDNNE